MALSAVGYVYDFTARNSYWVHYVAVHAIVSIARFTAEGSPWICGETI